MKRGLFATIVVLILVVPGAHAQTTSNAVSGARAVADAASMGTRAQKVSGPGVGMVLATFDRHIVKAFNNAWQHAAAGTVLTEAVVLIVYTADGSCQAILPRHTNEHRRFTFRWQPGTIAIVHTHPNHSDPQPSSDDIAIAERFQVPMFTLTLRGMFLYDPTTKAITKVQDGIDWLEYSKWARYVPAMAAPLATRR